MRRTVRRASEGLTVVAALAAACGPAFETSWDDSPPGGAGGGGAGGGGTSGAADSGAPADEPGGEAAGGQGAGGDSCGLLDGQVLKGHCYVDVTRVSVTQPEAEAVCSALAAGSRREAHLLVLDSVEEQNFVLTEFLRDFTDVSDAWLGLTCAVQSYPDINACYCAECTEEELSKRQRAWQWLDGTSATFGWVNANPNGPARCAALAYNPDLMLWGWVERQCDQAMVTPIPNHPHTYRVLCEVEP